MVVALWHFENPTNPWYSMSSNLGNKDRDFGFFSWRASLQTVELPGKISGSAFSPSNWIRDLQNLDCECRFAAGGVVLLNNIDIVNSIQCVSIEKTINVVWALIYSQSWLVCMKCEWKWKLHSLETNQEETIEKNSPQIKLPIFFSGSISASNRRKISSRGYTPQNG